MSGTRHSLQLSVAVGLLCLVTLTWASRESSPPQLPINRDFTSSSKHDESRPPGGELGQTADDRFTNDGSNKQWPTHHTSRSSQDVEQTEEEGGGGEGSGSDDAMDFQWTIVSFAVIFVLISLFAIGCGIYMLCRKDNPDSGESGPGYSVAISNRLFKEGGMDKNDLPCLNCRLIEMGEMACYQDTCPQCGNIPPCRKHLYPEAAASRHQPQALPPQQQQQQRRYQTVVHSSSHSKGGGGQMDAASKGINGYKPSSKIHQEPV